MSANSKPKKPSKIRENLRPLIGIAVISLIIGGFFFPFLMTGIGQVFFPYQANGDLAKLNGRVVGSVYIDNGFTSSLFFHTRNESNPENASASGVDPDITVAQALSQVPGISNASGIPQAQLNSIVNNNIAGTVWIFGTPYVDVLQLNIILIQTYPAVYSNFTSSS